MLRYAFIHRNHNTTHTALPTVTTYSPMQLAVQPSLRAERMLMTAPAMTSTMVLKEGSNQGNAYKSANHAASWHTHSIHSHPSTSAVAVNLPTKCMQRWPHPVLRPCLATALRNNSFAMTSYNSCGHGWLDNCERVAGRCPSATPRRCEAAAPAAIAAALVSKQHAQPETYHNKRCDYGLP